MKTKELLKGMMLSMMAHPSYQDGTNQEFIDYVSTAKSVLGIEDKIKEKKPLFVTEDGVEVFSDIDNLFAINLTYFSKTQNTLRSSRWLIDNPSYKVFSIESNADKYIWRNKPVFSYNDMVMAKKSVVLDEEDIVRLAKERSEE